MHHQDVAVEREQVEQRAVDHVAHEPRRAALLVVGQRLELGPDVRRLGARVGVRAQGPQQVDALAGVALGRGVLGLRLGGVEQLGGVQHGLTHAAQPQRHLQHLAAADPRLLVGGQAAGHADVALGGPRGEHRHLRVDAVALDQQRPPPPPAVACAGPTCRQRLRIVTSTSSALGAHSSHTVRAVGSSMALSSALPECSVSRSASSTTITRQRPTDGLRWATEMRSSACWRLMMTPSVRSVVTSAWLPASTVWQAWQRPQPASPSSQSRAAAKARAAIERPDPGGPVNSQACVIAAPSVRADCTARVSTSTVGCWPTTSSQTLTGRPAPRARRSPRPAARRQSSRRGRRRGFAGRSRGAAGGARDLGQGRRDVDRRLHARLVERVRGLPVLLLADAAAAGGLLGGRSRRPRAPRRCLLGPRPLGSLPLRALGGLTGLLLGAQSPRPPPAPAPPRRSALLPLGGLTGLLLLAGGPGHGRLRKHALQPAHHLRVDLVGGQRGVDDQVARGRTPGQLEEPLADAVVEVVGFGLQPVVLVTAPAAPLVRLDVQDDREVGRQALGGPARQLRHLGRAEVTTAALVGHGGVDEAVADDDLAVLERRAARRSRRGARGRRRRAAPRRAR